MPCMRRLLVVPADTLRGTPAVAEVALVAEEDGGPDRGAGLTVFERGGRMRAVMALLGPEEAVAARGGPVEKAARGAGAALCGGAGTRAVVAEEGTTFFAIAVVVVIGAAVPEGGLRATWALAALLLLLAADEDGTVRETGLVAPDAVCAAAALALMGAFLSTTGRLFGAAAVVDAEGLAGAFEEAAAAACGTWAALDDCICTCLASALASDAAGPADDDDPATPSRFLAPVVFSRTAASGAARLPATILADGPSNRCRAPIFFAVELTLRLVNGASGLRLTIEAAAGLVPNTSAC